MKQFAEVGDLKLDSGTTLPGVRITYETWGRPNAARDNAVLICHALTGDAHVVGPAGPGQPTPGWWDGLTRYLDPADWYVVAANVLGGCQGTTGPSTEAPDGRAWGSRFPRAHRPGPGCCRGAARRCARHRPLGGGDRRLDGWHARAGMAAAVRRQGGDYYGTGRAPMAGLGIARRIAHVTYRSEPELAARFGRAAQPGEDPLSGGRYAVESYLDHHADKLSNRFDPGSYVALTRAMNTHDITRDRGDLPETLTGLKARTVVAAVDSDRLYPPSQSRAITSAHPAAGPLHLINSPYGHDGFLIELDQVGQLITEQLRTGN
ncbi:alpha/beta fold hydrolase family protein [Kribbella sp. NPDC048928]|uniref:homoserine O-acetyltransferase family protein n=1 Tax=Kribbella sp. NPDC048928 TaxID=3364111 RepID=UPI0037187B02